MKIPFIIAVLFQASSLAAQTETPAKTYTVHINTVDSLVKAEVYYLNPDIKPRKGHFYCWYTPEKLSTTEAGFNGKLLHGEYVCSYPGKNMKEQGKYVNGLKDGTWKKWYSNGVVMETSSWKDGEKDGSIVLFGPTGQKVLEAGYKNGKLHGEVISYQDGTGKTIKKYKNGEEVQQSTTKEKENVTGDKPPKEPWLKRLFGKKKKSGTTDGKSTNT